MADSDYQIAPTVPWREACRLFKYTLPALCRDNTASLHLRTTSHCLVAIAAVNQASRMDMHMANICIALHDHGPRSRSGSRFRVSDELSVHFIHVYKPRGLSTDYVLNMISSRWTIESLRVDGCCCLVVPRGVKYLDMHNTTMPTDAQTMHCLETVRLSCVAIPGSWHRPVGMFSALQSLSVSYDHHSTDVCTIVGPEGVAGLQYLSMDACYAVRRVTIAHALKSLDMSYMPKLLSIQIQNGADGEIPTTAQLTTVTISTVEALMTVQLGGCVNLHSVRLQYADNLTSLQLPSQVHMLHLRNVPSSALTVAHLDRLHTLHISNALGDGCTDMLSSLCSLVKLTLCRCRGLTVQTIQDVMEKNEHTLQHLGVMWHCADLSTAPQLDGRYGWTSGCTGSHTWYQKKKRRT
jgi:hypothetical protein